jgi:protein gp37
MSATTSIEWTDRTWNPVTGCDKVSPGCAHCYAEGVANRFWASQYPKVRIVTGSHHEDERPRKFTDVLTHEDRLLEPLSWRKPARVFVNSMSDLFHEDVPEAFIDKVFAVMALAPQHTFQILTKRPERMRDYIESRVGPGVSRATLGQSLVSLPLDLPKRAGGYQIPYDWPLPNVWLGVSVENQHFADERIPLLLQTPAAVRFISAEPLLGPVGMYAFLAGAERDECLRILGHGAAAPAPGLDWVIVGGESGPGARAFDLAWARSIVAQCKAAGVPVFVKQLGAAPREVVHGPRPPLTGVYEPVYRSRKGGDPSEWPADLQVRQFPELAVG